MSTAEKDTQKKVAKTKIINTPLHGIYLPVFFMIVGFALMGLDKIIYGVALASILLIYRYTEYSYFGNAKKLVKDQFRPFELINKTIISSDCAIYRFKLNDKKDSIEVPLGHHLAVSFKKLNDVELEKECVRYYTPISSKYENGFFDIMVKSYPDGQVSKELAMTGVHQNINFKGPVGRFNAEKYLTLDHCSLDENADSENKKVILIAGGSGITPFLRIITESPNSMNFKLIYHFKTSKDISGMSNAVFKPELDEIAQFKTTFSVSYNKGLLTEENLTENISNGENNNGIDRDSSILICGPEGFTDVAKKTVEKLGFENVFVF